jgi:protein-disulfide isomerase
VSPLTDPDLTRKERREQARSERRAREQAATSQAVRRARLIRLASVLGAVVVIVAVILIATGGSGSSNRGLAKGDRASAEVKTVSALLDGIPQAGNALGNPKAPVTLQYFGDLECPYCRVFTLDVLPGLIEKYVRAGKLRVEYMSLETATREPETFRTQQVAAYAAGKQNRAWYFIELFYHEQGQEESGYVTESYLQGLSQQVPGLTLPDWSAARSEPALAEEVTRDAQLANQRGFTGTPSFSLGKTGDSLTALENPNLEQPSDFEAAIDKLLTASG